MPFTIYSLDLRPADCVAADSFSKPAARSADGSRITLAIATAPAPAPTRSGSVAEMNEAVLQAIEAHALTPDAIEQVIQLTERDDVRDQQAALARERKDVERRIANITAAIEADGLGSLSQTSSVNWKTG